MMTWVGFVILFSLTCVLFSCEGQVYPPLNKTTIVVLRETNATLNWTFVGDPSLAILSWFFTRRNAGSKEETLAVKFRTNDPIISGSSLSGIAIDDQATLVLNNVNDSYNGKYRLLVSVAGGGGESSVEFFIAVTPVISVNCSSPTTVTQGDYFACECGGTDGNPPADVTWYRNNTQIGVTGNEKAILSLNNVDKDDNGTYRCEAKSGIEEAKNKTSVDLIVNLIPIITISCSNVTYVNQNDNFECECKGTDGNPPADVTWYKDNRNISVTGKEAAILSLSNVSKGDSGTYRCEAKSSQRAKNETSMELIVTITPIITVECFSRITVNQSDNFACECNGTNGNPPADVTWYNSSGRIVTGKEKAILVLSNVSRDDNGTYKCEAKSHENAKNETSIELIVNYPPENVHLMLTRKGQRATIACTAEARPEPRFKILLNETNLVKSDKTYTISEVNRRHVGNYTCVAKNILGQRSSDPVYLSFEATPIITVNCSDPSTVRNGDDFTCECKGKDGYPRANVTWYKNNTDIVTGIEEAILVLSNVSGDDNGTYICEAKSHENAKNETSIDLIVTVTSTTKATSSTTMEQVMSTTKATKATKATSSTTMEQGPGHKKEQSDGLRGGEIAGITIGVLALLGIPMFVVYYIKTRKRQGYKGNANVNPDDADVVELNENEGFAKGENSYDSVKADDAYACVKGDNAYDSIKGDNAYDSVNHSGSSASTSKPPEDTLPPVYAAVDKGNKKGKPLYATLDSVALDSAGSQKSKESRPPPTEYATLDSLALQSNDSTKRDEDRPKPTEYADIDFLKSKEGENTGHPV